MDPQLGEVEWAVTLERVQDGRRREERAEDACVRERERKRGR